MSDHILNVGQALTWANDKLNSSGIENPRLNSEMMLCAVLRIDKTHLYLDTSYELDFQEFQRFKHFVNRRSNKEPVQYITGKAGFMGREFCVGPGALIPRPETETMVDACIDYLIQASKNNETLNVLDLCTGSGCIAISIAAELKKLDIPAIIYATDISEDALQLAQKNAKIYNVADNVIFLQGNMSEPVEQKYPQHLGRFDLIVSNPPYVPSKVYEKLILEVKKYEPKIALEAGKDGMKFFYSIADFAAEALKPRAKLSIELYETNLNIAVEYLETLKYDNIEIYKDLANKPRYITARKR